MPQVDFYISPDQRPEARERLCCRLAEKAYRAGQRVYIHAASGAQARRLDELLWTWRDGSFLPHTLYPAGNGDPSPVLIGHRDDPPGENQVLINLADVPPPFARRFARLLEPVAGSDEERATARRRYRSYQQQGYTPGSHEVSA
ncbi:DNA polymerase III subunit chi [Endothiovibrio diazotrophicus]